MKKSHSKLTQNEPEKGLRDKGFKNLKIDF